MCYKLVDNETGKIINRSVIVLLLNLTLPISVLILDPIESLPADPDDILDEMMSTADFGTPLSSIDPIDSIPASIKSRTWQEMEQDEYVEHEEDTQ